MLVLCPSRLLSQLSSLLHCRCRPQAMAQHWVCANHECVIATTLSINLVICFNQFLSVAQNEKKKKKGKETQGKLKKTYVKRDNNTC